MNSRAARAIETVIRAFLQEGIAKVFLSRLQKGALTQDENPKTHFCVYFASYDPEVKEIFMGHHKKSGLWLVNGGHIDRGETPTQALKREIREEWGMRISARTIASDPNTHQALSLIKTQLFSDRRFSRRLSAETPGWSGAGQR